MVKLDLYDVVLSPRMSDKAKFLNDKLNQIVIEVHKDANKIQIKKAVEAMFGVGVAKVNTINVLGKTKLSARRFEFYKKDYKKAIITFKDKGFVHQMSESGEFRADVLPHEEMQAQVAGNISSAV